MASNILELAEYWGNEEYPSKVVALALYAVHNPKRFKVLKGLVHHLSPREIAKKYHVSDVLVYKILKILVAQGLASKVRMGKRAVYVLKPEVSQAFRLAVEYVKKKALLLSLHNGMVSEDQYRYVLRQYDLKVEHDEREF